MKKKLLCIVTMMLLSFSLYSCTTGSDAKPVEHTIGEMKFTVFDDMTEEKSHDEIIQNLLKLNIIASADEYDNLYLDAKWFYNEDYDLFVSARIVPYFNNELDTCIEEAFENNVDNNKSKNVKVGKLNGKMGSYENGPSQTHYLYLLNNGILYVFEMSLNKDVSYANTYLEDLAKTISFDRELLGTQDVTCGDIQLKLPENYQTLAFNPTKGAYDEKWYRLYGESYIEFGMVYVLEKDWGKVAEIVADIPKTYKLTNTVHTTETCPLGTCDYVEGIGSDGDIYITALIVYNDKIYWLDMYGTEEVKQEMRTVVNTISNK